MTDSTPDPRTVAEELRQFDDNFDSWDTDRKIPKDLFDRILAALRTCSDSAEGQGLCDTTMTERFDRNCACGTYEDNMGPCAAFLAGCNGRCVYCDHAETCHCSTPPSADAGVTQEDAFDFEPETIEDLLYEIAQLLRGYEEHHRKRAHDATTVQAAVIATEKAETNCAMAWRVERALERLRDEYIACQRQSALASQPVGEVGERIKQLRQGTPLIGVDSGGAHSLVATVVADQLMRKAADQLASLQAALTVARERGDRLRGALIEAGRNAGALLTDQVSDEFLMLIPGEVKARVALTSREGEVERLREALDNCSRRLRNATIAGGSDEEFADLAIAEYRDLIARAALSERDGG